MSGSYIVIVLYFYLSKILFYSMMGNELSTTEIQNKIHLCSTQVSDVLKQFRYKSISMGLFIYEQIEIFI